MHHILAATTDTPAQPHAKTLTITRYHSLSLTNPRAADNPLGVVGWVLLTLTTDVHKPAELDSDDAAP